MTRDEPWLRRFGIGLFVIAPLACWVWRLGEIFRLQSTPGWSTWDAVLWLWCSIGWLAWVALTVDCLPLLLMVVLVNPVSVPMWMKWAHVYANRQTETIFREQGQTAMAWVVGREWIPPRQYKTGSSPGRWQMTVAYPTPDARNILTPGLNASASHQELSSEMIAPYRAATGGHDRPAHGLLRYVPEQPWLYRWADAPPLPTEPTRWMRIGALGHMALAALTLFGLVIWKIRTRRSLRGTT